MTGISCATITQKERGRLLQRQWLSRIFAGVVLTWCLLAAVSALLATRERPRDQWEIATFDRQFRALAIDLPPYGTVGYLEPYLEPGSDRSLAMYYGAQYSLAPRVLDRRPTHEFLIVPSGAARPEGDPRLEGYARVAAAPGGHELMRRFP